MKQILKREGHAFGLWRLVFAYWRTRYNFPKKFSQKITSQGSCCKFPKGSSFGLVSEGFSDSSL